MKKLGLPGGISWVSSLDYYKYINEGVDEKLGGLNFAECVNAAVEWALSGSGVAEACRSR